MYFNKLWKFTVCWLLFIKCVFFILHECWKDCWQHRLSKQSMSRNQMTTLALKTNDEIYMQSKCCHGVLRHIYSGNKNVWFTSRFTLHMQQYLSFVAGLYWSSDSSNPHGRHVDGALWYWVPVKKRILGYTTLTSLVYFASVASTVQIYIYIINHFMFLLRKLRLFKFYIFIVDRMSQLFIESILYIISF